MKLEQAVFTSADTARMRGYQLVSRSAGINDALANELSVWCPTHSGLTSEALEAESLSCFPLTNGRFAVTRSIYGGPEYSGRGHLKVVTTLLVLRPEQFQAYEFRPLLFARTAMLFGHLWLRESFPARLPAVELPDLPPKAACGGRTQAGKNARREALLEQSMQTLGSNRRLAILGYDKPLDLLRQIFDLTPTEARGSLSFTTGSQPTALRPFRIHFLANSNPKTNDQLQSQGITLLSA